MKLSVKKYFSRKTTPFLILILFFAFFLRAQESISGNYLFLLDQGRDMMDVKSIVFDGKLTLRGPYTGLQGVFQGPLWYYLLAIPTFLLRGDPIGTVWLMLILSMLVVVTSYHWIGKQFGVVTGLIAAFLLAFSPQAIAASTYSWNPHPLWILILLYIIFFYNATRGNFKHYLLALPVISLMFHFETALAVFVLVATVLYIIIFKKSHVKSKYFLFGILLSGLLFLPQVLFDFRHDFIMTRSIVKIFLGSNQGLFVTGEEKGYLDLIRSHSQAVIENFRSAFPFDGILWLLPYLMFGVILSGAVMVFSFGSLSPPASIKQFKK